MITNEQTPATEAASMTQPKKAKAIDDFYANLLDFDPFNTPHGSWSIVDPRASPRDLLAIAYTPKVPDGRVTPEIGIKIDRESGDALVGPIGTMTRFPFTGDDARELWALVVPFLTAYSRAPLPAPKNEDDEEHDLAVATGAGMDAFWAAVAHCHPLINTGDHLPPDAWETFKQACLDVVEIWRDANMDHCADCGCSAADHKGAVTHAFRSVRSAPPIDAYETWRKSINPAAFAADVTRLMAWGDTLDRWRIHFESFMGAWTATYVSPDDGERKVADFVMFLTPDFDGHDGKICVQITDDHGTQLGDEADIDWPLAGRTPESYLAAIRPLLERWTPRKFVATFHVMGMSDRETDDVRASLLELVDDKTDDTHILSVAISDEVPL